MGQVDCEQCEIKQVIINRLTRRIMAAKVLADKIIYRADKVMSIHQPRGKWSYVKGQKVAAAAVKNLLER